MHVFISINLLSLASGHAVAKENHYQLNEIAQLNLTLDKPSQWVDFISSPDNKAHYFVINKRGKMYLVDETKKLRQVLNVNAHKDQQASLIKLTAIELHPNFALRDQPGYGTFYTAHLENLDKKSNIKRIQDSNNGLEFKFDAVITEWQFYSSRHQTVDMNTKREVVRIAIPDNSMAITQMSFNHETTLWDEEFGLLYIALNGDEKWQNPLYSGVILRINPAKFGLLNFTIPASNPYVKNDDINDEIYLLGGQNIKQFIWPIKGDDTLLLSHQYNDNSLLSWTNINNDWRDDISKNIVYQSKQLVEDILFYKGRDLTRLRNTLLLLTKGTKGRQVNYLKITHSPNTAIPENIALQRAWQFSAEQFSYDSEVLFTQTVDGEVLMIDKILGSIFQVSLPSVNESNVSPIKTAVIVDNSMDKTHYIYITVIILLLLGGVFYTVIRNKSSVKTIVQKQFAQLELSESQQQIGFYLRHSKNIDTIVNIADITTLEVKLNDLTVNVIDQNEGNGFDDVKEQKLRALFVKEKIDKMVEGKIRQINLSFTDCQQNDYIVCLYMRKGSNRITKKTYLVVIEDLIDWCWLIAEKINACNTETRKRKPIISVTSVNNDVAEKSNHLFLNKEVDENRLSAYKEVKSQQESENTIALESNETIKGEVYTEVADQTEQNKQVDTQLVNSLEKLANLRKQGFLTEEEFVRTKESLLQTLSE
jgi:hypothetical protein